MLAFRYPRWLMLISLSLVLMIGTACASTAVEDTPAFEPKGATSSPTDEPAAMPSFTPTATQAWTPTSMPVATDTTMPTEESVNVATTEACPMPTGWTTYLIQPGDTLSAIGRRVGLSVQELQNANCLEMDKIIAGKLLFVPFLPATVTLAAPDTPTPTSTLIPPDTPTPTNTPLSPPPTRTYTPTPTLIPPDTPTPTNTPLSPPPTRTHTPTPTLIPPDTPTPTRTHTPTPTPSG